jgi:hypothetical protein
MRGVDTFPSQNNLTECGPFGKRAVGSLYDDQDDENERAFWASA